MEIEIDVFYHSNETLERKNLELPYSVVECDTRMRTFYRIDSISSWEDSESGEWFCEIISGDKEFIATKSYEEIKELIKKNIT